MQGGDEGALHPPPSSIFRQKTVHALPNCHMHFPEGERLSSEALDTLVEVRENGCHRTQAACSCVCVRVSAGLSLPADGERGHNGRGC